MIIIPDSTLHEFKEIFEKYNAQKLHDFIPIITQYINM
jgi:hypothetical protein